MWSRVQIWEIILHFSITYEIVLNEENKHFFQFSVEPPSLQGLISLKP